MCFPAVCIVNQLFLYAQIDVLLSFRNGLCSLRNDVTPVGEGRHVNSGNTLEGRHIL